VLVKKLGRKTPVLMYSWGSDTFYTAAPVLVALSDYDFTHVPRHADLSNERVMSGKYKVDGRPNDSYDTHFFLKSVMKCIQRRTRQFPRAWKFLTGLGLKMEDRQNNKVIPSLRPPALLKHSYFHALKKKPAGGVNASYGVHAAGAPAEGVAAGTAAGICT